MCSRTYEDVSEVDGGKVMKDKKDGIKVNYILDRRIAESLEEFCQKTGRTKTKVVELALEKFIEEHKNEM